MTYARRVDQGSRKHKYGAVPTEVDGIRFHSKAEARRYGELKLLEKAGEIRGIECQPKFPLLSPGVGNGGPYERRHIGDYVADFRYEQYLGAHRWRQVVEDVKGFDTPLSKWKRKHVEAQYGIQVKVIK